jgi:SEC-C motif/Protein of unknown function (DUF1186)
VIQDHIIALGKPGRLPVTSVEYCLAHYDEAAPFLRNALERAADGHLRGGNDELLFFRGLHIMAACRDAAAFEPLLRLLRRPQSEVDALLDDALTHSLQRVAIGLFNGDAWILFAAIVSANVGEYARSSLLAAASYLAWEGRIEREKIVELLTRIGTEHLGEDSEVFCYEWSEAVARLGLRALAPLVLDAAARGAIPDDLWLAEAFHATLDEAERNPCQDFPSDFVGPIADVVALLQEYDGGADGNATASHAADWADELPILQPAFNPWRKVGRNDPCPCGSGKKAKRCCLAA